MRFRFRVRKMRKLRLHFREAMWRLRLWHRPGLIGHGRPGRRLLLWAVPVKVPNIKRRHDLNLWRVKVQNAIRQTCLALEACGVKPSEGTFVLPDYFETLPVYGDSGGDWRVGYVRWEGRV